MAASFDEQIKVFAKQACLAIWALNGHKKPKEPKVRTRMRLLMHDTPVDEEQLELGVWFDLQQMPSKRWLQEFIKNWELPKPDTDDPWSIHEKQDDPSAIPALEEVWRYVTLNPEYDRFTVTLAEWVSKLRYFKAAGGSVVGQVADAKLLFRWAARFAAREKTAASLGEKDNRTNILMAKLVMTEFEFETARRLKVVDVQGINMQQELETYYPKEGARTHKEMQVLAFKRKDIEGYTVAAAKILDKYPPYEDGRKHAVNQAWGIVVTAASKLPRWIELRDDDVHPGIGMVMTYLLLKDIAGAYEEGRLYDYVPLHEDVPFGFIDGVMEYVVLLYKEHGWGNPVDETYQGVMPEVLKAAGTFDEEGTDI